MIYYSSLLNSAKYRDCARRLRAALEARGIAFREVDGTKDVWVRDYMPVRTRTGKYVSFRYEPSYLKQHGHLRTVYGEGRDVWLPELNAEASNINLDGGNVVFSPSREIAVVSDRVFKENSSLTESELLCELERLLEARVIVIPALGEDLDMTGHADGMVRFVSESTVIGNDTGDEHEANIRRALESEGLTVVCFPYYETGGFLSAEGCYLNYLETDRALFLPVFGNRNDVRAFDAASKLFDKEVVPVYALEIARDGGVLNCVTWEK